MGEIPGMGGMQLPQQGTPQPNPVLQQSTGLTGLPPKRAPGQPPLTSTLGGSGGQMPWSSTPAAPAAMPSFGGPDAQAGFSGSGMPNQSRLIPGGPALPNMMPGGNAGGGMMGMPNSLPGSSLLGREVSPAPMPSMTQPLQAGGAPPLSLGSARGQDLGASSHVGMAPGARNIASLRAPRGTNFIRLAFAAIFLIGFLGLVGYLLKDYLPGIFPSLAGHETAEETTKGEAGAKPQADLATVQAPSAPSISEAEKPAGTPPDNKPGTALVGFDPQETVAQKAKPPLGAESSDMRTASISSPPGATNQEVVPPAQPAPPTSGNLLEVPPKPSMAAESAGSPTATPAGLSQPHPPEEDESMPAGAKPAVEALKKFLFAKSLAERLPHTLGADVIKPLMERYYGLSPDGPISVDRIQFVRMDPNPELGSGKHCIFSLENKTWEFAVPVMLEEKEDGFKVDWVAFVEFKDRLLEKFFKTYQEGEPCYFHVGIIRHHYFKDDVPNLERKDVFRVSPAPPNSFQECAFLDKNSELAEKLRVQLPWETHVWAVVGLQWKKLGSQQWVELSSVPQMHWYSLPTTATAPKAKSLSTAQTTPPPDMPPGISKNGVRGKSTSQPNNSMAPPGIRKSTPTPELPTTIKRPLPAGR